VPRGHGSIIFGYECAPYIDSRYHWRGGGRWHGVLCKGFGPDGKRRRYKVSGRTTSRDSCRAPAVSPHRPVRWAMRWRLVRTPGLSGFLQAEPVAEFCGAMMQRMLVAAELVVVPG
jgi:hypothetical protein